MPGSIDPGGREIDLRGSGTARHPALLNAVLSAVHAGGEQGWESGHLEPFSFLSLLSSLHCDFTHSFAGLEA